MTEPAELRVRECPKCCNEISDPTDVSCNVCSTILPLPAPYCHCGCCREAAAKARTGRPVVEGCSCGDYGPAEKCDCPYCLLVREVTGPRHYVYPTNLTDREADPDA